MDITEDRGKQQRLYLHRHQRNKKEGKEASQEGLPNVISHILQQNLRGHLWHFQRDEEHCVHFFLTASTYALHLIISEVLIILKDGPKPGYEPDFQISLNQEIKLRRKSRSSQVSTPAERASF